MESGPYDAYPVNLAIESNAFSSNQAECNIACTRKLQQSAKECDIYKDVFAS